MKHRSFARREFLKNLTAAAAAAPMVISSTALGGPETPSASERVTLGHIGVGNRGRSLFASSRRCKDAQIVAIADAYRDRREACAAECGGRAYADFRELLARRDIDAVVIATPDHWHIPLAVAAAKAGKDAYVEKPLGISIEQDLLCRRVFQEQRRIFQYGTQQRSSVPCRVGCELVRSGKIGKVHTIQVSAPNGGSGGSTRVVPVPATLDYEMWLGPASETPYTPDRCNPNGTYWIYDYSIGYLGGWGAHPLDLMIWGSDADLSGPVTVEGTGTIGSKGLYDTVYSWNMKIQLGDVNVTFKHGGDLTKFIGDEGWIMVRRGAMSASSSALAKLGQTPSYDSYAVDTANHVRNFIDAVKARKQPVSPLADAVRSDIISHLCDIAVRQKRKITWDAKLERIVGDEEAAKMMHREMRAPWTL